MRAIVSCCCLMMMMVVVVMVVLVVVMMMMLLMVLIMIVTIMIPVRARVCACWRHWLVNERKVKTCNKTETRAAHGNVAQSTAGMPMTVAAAVCLSLCRRRRLDCMLVSARLRLR
jgi:hypothetical protein